MLKSLSKHRDLGLLILRIGIGFMMSFHGYPKILGGPDKWEQIGGAMSYIGIDILPVFWGLMASATEFLGGLLLMVGLATRPVCILLAFTMFVAASMHLGRGDGFGGASHAIELGILFVSLIFLGPGKYSADRG